MEVSLRWSDIVRKVKIKKKKARMTPFLIASYFSMILPHAKMGFPAEYREKPSL
jgi:hypothetical protein